MLHVREDGIIVGMCVILEKETCFLDQRLNSCMHEEGEDNGTKHALDNRKTKRRKEEKGPKVRNQKSLTLLICEYSECSPAAAPSPHPRVRVYS